MSTYPESSLESLKAERYKLTEYIHRKKFLYYSGVIISLVLLVFTPVLIFLKPDFDPVLKAFLIAYCVIAISFIFVYRTHLRSIEEELKGVEFEIDLEQLSGNVSERRAEKLLRANQIQLRRYYDLNLKQNIWMFVLGIFCIISGLFIIVFTFHILLKFTSTINEKIIIATIGLVSSIASNLIAATFLKMHAAAVRSLESFHTKLVGTHTLFLGNLLASRIEDDEKRWHTLSELALRLSIKESKE